MGASTSSPGSRKGTVRLPVQASRLPWLIAAALLVVCAVQTYLLATAGPPKASAPAASGERQLVAGEIPDMTAFEVVDAFVLQYEIDPQTARSLRVLVEDSYHLQQGLVFQREAGMSDAAEQGRLWRTEAERCRHEAERLLGRPAADLLMGWLQSIHPAAGP